MDDPHLDEYNVQERWVPLGRFGLLLGTGGQPCLASSASHRYSELSPLPLTAWTHLWSSAARWPM